MSIWNDTTQPPPALDWTTQSEPTPDTLVAYLKRHHLSYVEAARLAALPALLVWRAAKWLPISEKHARTLVTTLNRATGEPFCGFLMTTHQDTWPKAIRFGE